MKHNWIEYFDVDSDYWKKVEKIYNENDHFPKKVVKHRNLHHKFPRSFSKKEGIDIDNDEDNLVSLSLSDHFLVHYYLWKCSKKDYRKSMALAFQYMCRIEIKYASDETIEELAKDYDNLKKDVREKLSDTHKGKRLSEESRKKISDARKGIKFSDETKKKISDARKGIKFSDETKKKISDAKKGKTSNRKGKKWSEEHKKKLSDLKKGNKNPAFGMYWYNNGETNVRAKECPEGFVPGMLKRETAK